MKPRAYYQPYQSGLLLAQVLHAEQWRLGGGEGLGQQQAGLIGLIVCLRLLP